MIREAPTDTERAAVRKARDEILASLEDITTWMSAKRAAAYLEMNDDEFRKLVKETPEIVEYKISERRIRYRRHDIDEWMLSRANG